jgi:hypothetical protein
MLVVLLLPSNPVVVSANEGNADEKRIYEAEHAVATARAIMGNNIYSKELVVSLQLTALRRMCLALFFQQWSCRGDERIRFSAQVVVTRSFGKMDVIILIPSSTDGR